MAMTCQFETSNGMLLVNGSLDRAADNDFAAALEKYCAVTAPDHRVVDMSHVRWLAPTGAKVLIQSAQDTQEKNGKMRVLASRHVFQTLNLLGAKTWMNIEVMHISTRQSAIIPTQPEPKVEAPPPAAHEAPKEDIGLGAAVGDLSLDPSFLEAALSASSPSSGAAAHAGASVAEAVRQEIHAPRTVPAPKNSGASSGALPAVRAPAPNTALAYPLEDLAGAAHLLRVLHTGKRYLFHFGMGEGYTGIIRERIGGPWITVEVDGIRKWVNLELVAYCEPM
jgi:anti-anti-sigma factor